MKLRFTPRAAEEDIILTIQHAARKRSLWGIGSRYRPADCLLFKWKWL
jgi:hypothetical protein